MNWKSIKHKHGRYEKLLDGSYKLVENNYIIDIAPEATFGFTYEVQSAKKLQFKVVNDCIYPDGKKTTTHYSIESNKVVGSIITISKIEDSVKGKLILRVSFPDNKELETLEQIFFLYEKAEGMLFQNKPFTPALDQDILEFEKKYSTSFCHDYKQFLKTYNGLDLCWWSHAPEFDKNKNAYSSNKYGFEQTYYPFYEDMRKITENWEWLYETDKLFGLSNKNPYLDLKYFFMQDFLYHNDLVKYAYPIGEDGGGNCLVQIAQGKYRGKLAMLDHEVSSVMVDWVEGKTQDVYKISPEKTTPDDFLDNCFEYGGLTLYEIDFNNFFTQLLKNQKELYDQLKHKYSK